MKHNLEKKFSTFDLLLGLALIAVLVINITVIGSLRGPGERKASKDAVTVTGTAPGKVGDVSVEVVADAQNIYSVTVTAQNETPGIGSLPVEELPAAIGKANSLAVDGVSTATVTSDAIKAAVANALESAGFDPAAFGYVLPEPEPAPAAEAVEVAAPVAAEGGKVTAQGKGSGIDGDVIVEVTADENTIYEVNILQQNETPGIGSVAVEKLPGAIIAANSLAVDGITGATVTSTAIKTAVTEALTSMGFDPANYAGAAAGTAAPAEKTAVELDCDVVVVGAGGAGLTASVMATQQGMNVILLEKMPFVGGNSLRAEGGMNAADTKVQAELGITDSTVENYIEDTLRLGHDLGNPELVRTLAENSAEAVDWLFTIDAPLTKVKATGGTTHKYLHQPEDGSAVGSYLVAKLSAEAEKLGIDVRVNTRATEILMENGQAVGVMAEDEEHIYTVKAKSVVLATGGFGANFELMASFDPSLANAVTTNHAGATGDGILMAQAVGADTVDMEQIQLHPTVIQSNGLLVSESLRSYGAVIVNTEGKRFVNDLAGRDVVSQAELKQPNGYCFIIFDQNMVDNLALTHKFIDGGYTLTGETYEELAGAMGLEGDAIQNFVNTMNAWNESCEKGEDAEWGRNNGMEKLALAPFYAIKIAPGIHHTMGGIKIDTAAEVIGTDGNVIPGLFACGETTGGIHGGNRVGGNAVCDFIVFGRIAGQSAADFAKPAPKAALPAAVEGADGKVTAYGRSLGKVGDVTVEVVADADTIYAVTVTEQNETAGIGSRAVEEIPAAIVAANSIDVDAVSGATITSDAIRAAAAWALRETPFGKTEEPAPAEAPAEPASVEPGEPVRSTASSLGKNGPVTVEVLADRNTIYEVTVLEHSETKGVGSVAVDWIPARIVEANSIDVDAVSGATVTTDAIRAAVAKALRDAPYTAPEVPAPAEPIVLESTVSGRNGPMVVSVTADAENIYEVKVLMNEETVGVGSVAVDWLPGRIVEANSIDIDGITGATITSDAIKLAVSRALEFAASGNQPAAAPAGPVTVQTAAEGRNGPITVEVTVEDGNILDVKVLEHSETVGVGAVAVDWLPGRIVEANSIDIDGITGATITSDAIKSAVRTALDQAA